jgi:hypothetical protein
MKRTAIVALDHISLTVRDLEAARAFHLGRGAGRRGVDLPSAAAAGPLAARSETAC